MSQLLAYPLCGLSTFGKGHKYPPWKCTFIALRLEPQLPSLAVVSCERLCLQHLYYYT